MVTAGKDVEIQIQKLAQMARAAGIHVIMATQRPSTDVITGVIKANFPSRISFKVASSIDSRVIIGEQGAEQLLGMGDMLYMGTDSSICRLHAPFVSDQEVQKVVEYLKNSAKVEYFDITNDNSNDDSSSNSTKNNSREYQEALDIVLNEKKATISYLQRRLGIGYNKAANLIEELERNGIISQPNHQGKREIL